MDVHQQSTLEADYAALELLLDKIAAADSTPCTDAVVAGLAERHERAVRRMESIGNRRILEVSDREAFRASGCQSISEFVATTLRITQPKKRLRAVQSLESLHAMTGEKMAPTCPNTARELAAGSIGADHVNVVLDVMARIPAAVTPERREFAEKSLAEYATTLTPRKLTAAGVRILAHLDPDGTLTDDRDRARNRKLSLGSQDSQLMSKLSATLDPTTRALFDVVLAAWAAPGMNNPDDENSPRGDKSDAGPEAVREAADRDHRSQLQRNHDALAALLRSAVDGGLLGTSHRGLPPHVIISMTETQLRERAGVVRTATGTDLPISDALTLAADAQMHLAVFDDHTDEALFYGRSRRLASQAQRFVAFAKYRGCSKDDCSVPFAHTEMHHAEKDWADGGRTDSNHLAPACGPHNRAVGPEPHQWTTEKITEGPDRGRYGWRRNTDPPDRLRANRLHRIDELLDRHRASRDGPRGEEPCHAVVTPLSPPGFDIAWPTPVIRWAA
ncbi:HNH endonuclease signature motif containing protein [Williamsia maris]|uniref:DUF222 domain-containing protein n=1 Tax=Williamsia maris TaxID=72806 RepID=A0ABT1HEC7_9NOCA|nr:HNH endonuclease signature motif containing protein [Williamsia maris]MCP2176608.1 protein of unknown function (DUF222) [Williamsia maris]